MTIKHRASCQSRVFWCLSNLPNMAGMCGPNFRPVYCCCCEFWNPPTVAGIGQTAQMMQPVRFDVVATDILHITYYYYYITYSRLCAAHQLSSVCAQSSFLPSTEHLRNEPTFKKSPAYFKPFFEALPTDRFPWFFVMRGLMPRPQWFDSLLRPKRPGKAVPRYRMHQVAVRRSESPTRNFGLELTPPHFPGGNETFKKRGCDALFASPYKTKLLVCDLKQKKKKKMGKFFFDYDV